MAATVKSGKTTAATSLARHEMVFSVLHARAWLVSQAARERFEVGGVEVLRGQALVSDREIAQACGWSRMRVARWLGRLEDARSLRRTNVGTHGTTLTIENFEGILAHGAGYGTPCERLDGIEQVRGRIVSTTGLRLGPSAIAERSMIRRWRGWLPDVEIVATAVRAALCISGQSAPTGALEPAQERTQKLALPFR